MKHRPFTFLFAALTLAGLALTSASAHAENSLTLHLIRSPGLDWSTPNNLAKSTIRNAVKGRYWPIGHVSAEIRCGSKSVKTGMTQRFYDEDKRVVKKEKQGLGALFHNFAGRIQDDEAIDRSLSILLNSDRLGLIRFLISEESCQRMMEFHHNYVAQQMYQNYGLLSRPLQGEGGGCSAYAMAYPAVGGFLEPWMMEQWAQYRRVPRASVGGPLTNYRIGILKSMSGGPTRWAHENEAGFPLFFYDPDKIFDWARDLHSGVPVDGGLQNAGAIRRIPVTPDLLGIPFHGRTRAFAIEIDRSHVRPPQQINYSRVQRDPIEPLKNPSLLDTWWEKEIRTFRSYHRGAGMGRAILPQPESSPSPESPEEEDLFWDEEETNEAPPPYEDHFYTF